MTDVAVRMSEEQLVELRAVIKHFVSEREYDEDLGRVPRFTWVTWRPRRRTLIHLDKYPIQRTAIQHDLGVAWLHLCLSNPQDALCSQPYKC